MFLCDRVGKKTAKSSYNITSRKSAVLQCKWVIFSQACAGKRLESCRQWFAYNVYTRALYQLLFLLHLSTFPQHHACTPDEYIVFYILSLPLKSALHQYILHFFSLKKSEVENLHKRTQS